VRIGNAKHLEVEVEHIELFQSKGWVQGMVLGGGKKLSDGAKLMKQRKQHRKSLQIKLAL